jgi:hypothetical protein
MGADPNKAAMSFGMMKSLRLEVFFGIALVLVTPICLGPPLHMIRRPVSD